MDIEFYKIELGKAINKISDLELKLQQKEKDYYFNIRDMQIEMVVLEKEIEQLKLISTFGTPTDGLEVGSPEDYGEQPWIYESPDGGKTVYRRRAGQVDKTQYANSKQLNLFEGDSND